MDARRRAAADAVSRRNAAYPAGGDVLDTVFNRILLASSVCPSSAVPVRESAILVWLDPPQQVRHLIVCLGNVAVTFPTKPKLVGDLPVISEILVQPLPFIELCFYVPMVFC